MDIYTYVTDICIYTYIYIPLPHTVEYRKTAFSCI